MDTGARCSRFHFRGPGRPATATEFGEQRVARQSDRRPEQPAAEHVGCPMFVVDQAVQPHHQRSAHGDQRGATAGDELVSSQYARGGDGERRRSRRVAARIAVHAAALTRAARSLPNEHELDSAVHEPTRPRRGHDRRPSRSSSATKRSRDQIGNRDVAAGQPERKEWRDESREPPWYGRGRATPDPAIDRRLVIARQGVAKQHDASRSECGERERHGGITSHHHRLRIPTRSMPESAARVDHHGHSR